jgi:nucleoside-diphosphate kinase
MERTLTIIKPDAVQRNLAGKILARLEAEGFVILGLKMVHLSKQDAERFYYVHRERPFFEGLTSYMASGPAIPVLLQRENAIQTLRDIMGATNPAQAAAGTIRKEFGLDVEKNSIHGSDASTTAAWEIAFFFNHLEFREQA